MLMHLKQKSHLPVARDKHGAKCRRPDAKRGGMDIKTAGAKHPSVQKALDTAPHKGMHEISYITGDLPGARFSLGYHFRVFHAVVEPVPQVPSFHAVHNSMGTVRARMYPVFQDSSNKKQVALRTDAL